MTPGHAAPPQEHVWWPGHGNRLMFILRLLPGVWDAMLASLRYAGLGSLRSPDWPRECCHQSLSRRYADQPWVRQRLIAAGDQVKAPAFALELDRARAGLHAEVRARGRCAGLERLIDAIGAALVGQGLPRGGSHWPHVTLDYRYRGAGIATRPMSPVHWPVQAFELVAGGGRPYRYTPLARWQLDPPVPGAVQPDLFS